MTTSGRISGSRPTTARPGRISRPTFPCGPINVIREDPKRPNVLYVGTDLGVYVSVDGGAKWQVLANNLPTTFVHDLIIHPRDDIMVIATHGRGMFALDVQPIQAYGQPSEAKTESKARRRSAKESEAKEEAKAEAKEEVKEEAKAEAKEEAKAEAKEDVKDEPKPEPKEETDDDGEDEGEGGRGRGCVGSQVADA